MTRSESKTRSTLAAALLFVWVAACATESEGDNRTDTLPPTDVTEVEVPVPVPDDVDDADTSTDPVDVPDVPDESDAEVLDIEDGDVDDPEDAEDAADVPDDPETDADTEEDADAADAADVPGDVDEDADVPGDVDEDADVPADVDEDADVPGDVDEDADVPEDTDTADDADADVPGDVDEDADDPGDVDDDAEVVDPPWRPSFDVVVTPVTGPFLGLSTPRLVDLNGDGMLDIVFGSGAERSPPYTQPAVAGWVWAVSGSTNEVLWQVEGPHDQFTTPLFLDINQDGVMDVVMGGRQGRMTAYAGASGEVIWSLDGADVAETGFPYNFFSPALAGDLNGDGLADMVVTYGGDDTKSPGEDRDPGYVVAVSSRDGSVIGYSRTPDGAETYASPIVYRRQDGEDWVIFGTGGETLPGGVFRAPVASILDDSFGERVERVLDPIRERGVYAPVSLADITGDGELDYVIQSMDGRTVAVSGEGLEVLWEHVRDDEESGSPAAFVRLPDGRLGVFASGFIGEFPAYTGSRHRLLDALTGDELFFHEDEYWAGVPPLAVDLQGAGHDDVLFGTSNYGGESAGRLYWLDTETLELVTHEVPDMIVTSGTLAAINNADMLEWIVMGTSGHQNGLTARFSLLRLALDVRAPERITWGSYMGTNRDGLYRP